MKCIYCEREIKNKGSLVAHQNCCKANPNAVTKIRAPTAGAQKGSAAWNKGKKQDIEVSLNRMIEIVESGKLQVTYASEVSARRVAKRYLIHTQGNKCSICGTTEWMGHPVPLVCDHVSGDSTDNNIENFRLVCCNCDAQLPTFKSKNKGKGREYDRNYKRKKSTSNTTT